MDLLLEAQGKSCCASFKSLSKKLVRLCHRTSLQAKFSWLDLKIERKIMQLKRSSTGQNNFTSINSIILMFPQFREGLKTIKSVFKEYDEDSNGTIDKDELRKCLERLQLHFTEKDVEELFHSCDMDGSRGIQFKEFIVLLGLIYLLKEDHPSSSSTGQIGSPEIEIIFDTIVEAFLFLDKNGDGKLNKKDMIKALNDQSPWERSPTHISMTRFKEMDWDRNGNVTFREFLYDFTDWVGIDEDEEEIPIAQLE